MDTKNKTDPVEALRCEALFGDWTMRTAEAYSHYKRHCASKGQMPLPWDALTQSAKNYWVKRADAVLPNNPREPDAQN